MDSGGMTPEERQRQTAAEIARKKVVTAYSGQAINQVPQQTPPVQQTNTYKYANPGSARPQDWQTYHTAWQNYYQKYYQEYYSQAAQKFVENEKKKVEDEAERQNIAMQQLLQRRAAEQDRAVKKELQTRRVRELQKSIEKKKLKDFYPYAQQTLAGQINSGQLDQEQSQRVADKLKATVQSKAGKKFSVKRKHRKWIPVVAGVFTTLLILFLQYNRLVFAPIIAYVSPGNVSDEEITAIDPTVTEAPNGDSKLIIPKLNVNVPVFFGINNDKASLDKAMIDGVAHFRVPGASAFPGQVGNVVISGHSAGDIYSSIQYKFIFSGIERLVEGDLIYINYNHVRYTYKVNGNRRTVDPSDVAALRYDGDKGLLTLLTCWPVGTDRYRLLVEAEQINPVIEGSSSSDEPEAEAPKEEEMPKNEKTFFERIWSWLTGSE
ncbi:MAG: sortase [Candidatus Saccharibacteria bacterium]|nr:sortase [Candidatus Saccharibacteria bacterium]